VEAWGSRKGPNAIKAKASVAKRPCGVVLRIARERGNTTTTEEKIEGKKEEGKRRKNSKGALSTDYFSREGGHEADQARGQNPFRLAAVKKFFKKDSADVINANSCLDGTIAD